MSRADARASMRSSEGEKPRASPKPEPIESAAPKAPDLPPENHSGGVDYADEVRALYRVVACSGSSPIPSNLDAATVDAHCKDLLPKIAKYRAGYVAIAQPFLHALEPTDLPKAVVYPFGGGDLATAMTTYPDANEWTTLSLELAGDPRRIRSMDPDALARSLKKLRAELAELFVVDDYSRSETLKKTQRGDVPGELGFFLVALAVHGYEPVGLRYFTIRTDGAAHYLSASEIASLEGETAEHRKGTWTSPDFSEAFANSELTFRASADPSAPLRVHRHIAVNLSDDSLTAEPGVLAHLARKGDVAAMTKAASYLLWSDSFSMIRGYLLAHARFMVSDSTGIPPSFAQESGLTQETYGTFKRSLLHASFAYNEDFKKLWATEPARKLPFRFGYRDGTGHEHLLVTKREARK